MTFLTELKSWLPVFSGPSVSSAPAVGSTAPSHVKLPIPSASSKPTIITFLRHCGCPYAEKTLRILRPLAASHPEIRFVAISHSSDESTQKWLSDVGGADKVEIIVDAEREIYAAWGLGNGGIMSVLNGNSLGGVGKLEKEEGIKIRDTTSGSRWQKAGSFGVDKAGIVRWEVVAESAEVIGDFEEGIRKISN